MNINIKSLGYIDKAEIETNKITVICGDNSSGKTYLSYALYGFLKHLRNEAEFDIKDDQIELLLENGFVEIDLSEIENNLPKQIKKISRNYSKSLYSVFSASEDDFKDSEISFVMSTIINDLPENSKIRMSSKEKEIMSIEKSKGQNKLLISLISENIQKIPNFVLKSTINNGIGRLLFSNSIKTPFAVTSERTGVSLFYKDLDDNRNQIIDYLTNNKNANPMELLFELTSRYALPIKDNISLIRDIENIKKKKSFILENESDVCKQTINEWRKLIGGKFSVNGNSVYFSPKKERGRERVEPIPLHTVSSATKSLVLLDMYINHVARKNDILIIDEPELNLHPSNQIKLARIISLLSSCGIEIFLTTHSDYILKEFNNLIMLDSLTNNLDEVMKRHGYEKNMLISKSDINLYVVNTNHQLDQMLIDSEGIHIDLFDDTIIKINEIADDIYYSMD